MNEFHYMSVYSLKTEVVLVLFLRLRSMKSSWETQYVKQSSEFLKQSFCIVERRKKKRVTLLDKNPCDPQRWFYEGVLDGFMRECYIISHVTVSKLKHFHQV